MRRLFLLLAAVLIAALVLHAGLLAFAMYVLIGVLLFSRSLARKWVGSLEGPPFEHLRLPVGLAKPRPTLPDWDRPRPLPPTVV